MRREIKREICNQTPVNTAIKQFGNAGKDCRTLSAFMVGGNRKGSKKLRTIIENKNVYKPKTGTITKLSL